MSTTSTTTASTATTTVSAASTAGTSSKVKAFALTFSALGPLAYCLIQYFNLPLVTYHPATGRLVWGYEGPRPGEGPNMLWYGWTLTVLIVLTVLGLIATVLPESVTKKIPATFIWLLPILAIPYIVYSLMPWWILASK